MGHTVIQTDQSPISAEQLADAFDSIDRLTRADASILAKQTFGFYYEGLQETEAHALCAALNALGIGAAVVDDLDVFRLPDGKTFKRFDPLDDALVAYDVLGRPRSIPWTDVLVIAAGHVRVVSTVQKSKSVHRSAGSVYAGAAMGIPIPSATHVEVSHRESESTRLLLEIIVNDEICRYRADGAELLYLYLGDQRLPRAEENFPRFVSDLLSRATGTLFNQGAVSIVASPERPLVYPTRRSFEREISWLVWSGTQA